MVRTSPSHGGNRGSNPRRVNGVEPKADKLLCLRGGLEKQSVAEPAGEVASRGQKILRATAGKIFVTEQ